MTIHKEGKSLLITLSLALIIFNYGLTYFFPDAKLAVNVSIFFSVVLFLIVLQFFRLPNIKINKKDNCILAPADGKVVVIENTIEKEYFQAERKQVSIFMSPVNVHNNRFPMSGIITLFRYHAGKYLAAWHPKASTENERTTMVIEKDGVEILVRQIAGALARRIRWYVDEGDAAEQGKEYGFIKFGSRVDVFLPMDAEICVDIDQKTKGGQTVIAQL
ncbi:MAG: phosphatidylserine decarboxylase family protein [Cytophagales bacterium]|nr:phosphatidylserine decarboxylase family protein [Cytophagales bacterium]